jgi:hypothetical protein
MDEGLTIRMSSWDMRRFRACKVTLCVLAFSTLACTPKLATQKDGSPAYATSSAGLGDRRESTAQLPSSAPNDTQRLTPSTSCWDTGRDEFTVRNVALADGRALAAVGDSLYMLDSDNRILWTWTADGPPLTDLPIIDSRGIIYAIGYDLLWVAIDSISGREIWRGTACGGAVYTQIGLIRDDIYFVVVDMGGYREKLADATIKDELYLCRGNDIMWTRDIPSNSVVAPQDGTLIVTHGSGARARRFRMRIPPLRTPIGQASATYDSGSRD